MTSTAPDTISLADVRGRFMKAEESLLALASTMQSLQTLRESLGSASDGVDAARNGLLDVVAQLSPTLSEFSLSVTLVREAVSLLERSDPGVIQGRLSELSERLPSIEGEITSVRQALDAHAQKVVEVIIAQQHLEATRLLTELRQAGDARAGEVRESIDRAGREVLAGVSTEATGTLEVLREAGDVHTAEVRASVGQVGQDVCSHTTSEVARLRGELQHLESRLTTRVADSAAAQAERMLMLESRLEEFAQRLALASSDTAEFRARLERRLSMLLIAVGVAGVVVSALILWTSAR